MNYITAGAECRFLNIEHATEELVELLGEDINNMNARRSFFDGYLSALSQWIDETKYKSYEPEIE